MRSVEQLEAKFWSKVDRRGADECWPWTGTKTRAGYGRISRNGRRYVATRLSWEIANGKPFPEGKFACHSCDNPNCVNPNHIWPGTLSENTRDAIAKGRANARALRRFCPNGHPLEGDNVINSLAYRGCRTCAAEARPTFGHGGVCCKCGHARVDDYVEVRDGRPCWKCRACNHARTRRRQLAQAEKRAA